MKEINYSDINNGLKQNERALKSFAFDYFNIEERSTDDFLQFLSKISGEFAFYNSDNLPEGNWADLFTNELYFLIKLYLNYDITQKISRYAALRQKTYNAAFAKAQLAPVLKKLLGFLFTFIEDQHLFLETFYTATHTPIHDSLFEQLLQIDGPANNTGRLNHIAEVFYAQMTALKLLNGQVFDRFGAEYSIDYSINSYAVKHGLHITVDKSQLKEDRAFLPEHFLKTTDHIFEKLRKKFNTAGIVIQKTIRLAEVKAENLKPQSALILTFLELLKLVNTELNKLSKKHTDFYFKNILNFDKKKKEADTVHIVFQLTPTISNLLLPAGEEFSVKVPGNDATFAFKLDEAINITQAAIVEIKSVHTSTVVKSGSGTHPNSEPVEMEVFVKQHTQSDPGNFLKDKKNIVPWKLWGEDQRDLSDSKKTMDHAELGFFIFSPLLYVKSGQAAITFSFYFDASSYSNFLESIKYYAKHVNTKEQKTLNEFINNAFIISYTGKEKWNVVKKYSSTCSEAGDCRLDLIVSFDADAFPAAVYLPAAHGPVAPYENEISLPGFRFIINDNSFYNAYSFFYQAVVKMVCVTTNVEGSVDFSLQNNIGILNQGSPFQAFGPQPLVGSFLNIQNTNIFNKYTTGFSIKLNWLGLPAIKGGLKEYYNGYGVDISNDSFEVTLSSLSAGEEIPKTGKQRFKLFLPADAENNEAGSINPTTIITGADVKKIQLSAYPQISVTTQQPEKTFTDGTIHIELAGPAMGMGSVVYAQVLPEVILHNSRPFRAKKPTPNPPLAPMLKSASIDFDLAHTELLANINEKDVQETPLIIIHKHPFGFEKVYPAKNLAGLPFLPAVYAKNSLYLGLANVKPFEEINLYFELVDTESLTSEDAVPQVYWSYLKDNQWVDFKRNQLLFDTTNSLTNSGIVRILLPENNFDIKSSNTILNPDLFWIRVSSNTQGAVAIKVDCIFTHAAKATRIIDDNNLSATEACMPLPAGSLFSLKKKNTKVQAIVQPFSSFNGKQLEQDDQFYIRVGERLRHKGRLLTAIDISQMVLDKYPELLMVKCIAGNNQMRDIRVIVFPKTILGFTDYFKRKPFQTVPFAKLLDIKKFIQQYMPAFVTLSVENPEFEKIKVVCSIVAEERASHEHGFINQEISRLISPWLFDAKAKFGNTSIIDMSDLQSKIRNLPNVKHVTQFSLLHFYNRYNNLSGKKYYVVEDTVPFNSAQAPKKNIILHSHASVFIPSINHIINHLEKIEFIAPTPTGISSLALGDELAISEIEKNEAPAKKQEEEPHFNFFF